jgi:capsule biosynthesis phosphatase
MKENIKKIICDLDNTITIEDSGFSYIDKMPNIELIEKLRLYQRDGFEIIIHTARNMRSYNGDLSRINIYTVPVIIDWLRKHNVPYDGLVVGKPYCGSEGFYLDDRAIRPSEFLDKNISEIYKLINK